MRSKRAHRSERGATLVFFASIITGLLAISGLVVDGGFLYAERRQQQNASDAAAMAGVRALDQYQRGKVASVTAVWSAVEGAATENGADASEVRCTLVDELGAPIAGDSACPRPGNLGVDPAVRLELATGVKAETAATKDTSFLSVLGISQMRAPGDATATLQAVRGLLPGSAPFMVCGSSPGDLKAAMEAEFGVTFNPKNDDNLATPLIVRAGDGTWVPNGQAIYDPVTNTGPSIQVHGPQGVPQCGAGSGSFKGLVEEDADVTTPWVPSEVGTRAGPTRTVTAPYTATFGGQAKAACAAGQWHDCVLVLPICSHSNGGTGAGLEMRCVMFGAFYVQQTHANRHTAYFLGDAPVVLDGIGGGKPNAIEARMLRLID
jgi:Flp pilus assembly protein TadG